MWQPWSILENMYLHVLADINQTKGSLWNYCLHTRWTSKVATPRMVVFPEGLSLSENNLSRVDSLMLTSYEGNNCFLLYPNYSKMFNTWMFCFVEDNKIISSIEKTITETNWKKRIFSTLPIVRGCSPGDNLLSPSTIYMFG
jgi:hypothetical protein